MGTCDLSSQVDYHPLGPYSHQVFIHPLHLHSPRVFTRTLYPRSPQVLTRLLRGRNTLPTVLHLSLYLQKLSLAGNAQAFGEFDYLCMRTFCFHTLLVVFIMNPIIVGLGSSQSMPCAIGWPLYKFNGSSNSVYISFNMCQSSWVSMLVVLSLLLDWLMSRRRSSRYLLTYSYHLPADLAWIF